MQFAIDNGMIDFTTMQAAYDMNERKNYLEMHKFKIWQGNNGKWYTYLPDGEDRKLVKKNNYSKIEDMIVEYYKNMNDVTIREVFSQWIAEREYYDEVTSSTITRYTNDFKRFFDNSSISNKSFSKITEKELEKFIKDCIHDKELTQKTYSMLRLIITGIFRFGKANGYTDLSIVSFFNELYLSKGIFKKKIKKSDSEEVYNDYEVKQLTDYFKKFPTKRNVGLLLQFQTGMRIGEVAALKPCDISLKCVNVCRTEEKVLNKDTGKTELLVKNTTKTDAGNRTILLPTIARETVQMALSQSGNEFLFEEDGTRITTRRFGIALKKACKELNIQYRSSHKIRKTYASTLLKNGVNEDTVKEMLGHASITTTQNIYRFNTDTNSDKFKEIDNAINM